MNIKKLLWLIFIFLNILAKGEATNHEIAENKLQPIIGINKDKFVRIPPPSYFLEKSTETGSTEINVVYNGFPPEAKVAFEYAVSIWESLIVSDIPINISANWIVIDPSSDSNVLGSAGSTSFLKNLEGFPHAGVFYNIPLAEKLAKKELDAPNTPDISIVFNGPTNWYFGTDGQTPSGKYDLVTVAIHELCHGLGFIGSMDVNSEGQGEWGYGSIYPFPFDEFLYNGNGQQLIDLNTFSNPSVDLFNQLVSDNLFFNGPVVKATIGNQVKLYAPNAFGNGSSVYHLSKDYDESSSQLMTPVINTGASIHDPGPINMAILADIGWSNLFIDHQPIASTETVQDIEVTAKFTADFETNITDPTLVYTINGGEQKVIAMTLAQGSDSYSGTIPVNAAADVSYYLSVKDKYNRTFYYPNTAPQGTLERFEVGPDNVAPVITHFANDRVYTSETTLMLLANVEDNYGIDTVYIEYYINDVKGNDLGLMPTSANNFNIILDLSSFNLKDGDVVKYRIVARDGSVEQNIAYDPSAGYHLVQVANIPQYVTTYETDFTNNANEFLVDGFTYNTPDGFSNASLQSEHPYHSSSNDAGRDLTAQLLFPVKIEEAYHLLAFDEIALVEPGEDGAAFGDPDFNDYVVVEGSKDDGITWMPFEDGWDCRLDSKWMSVYNQSLRFNNSDLVGELNLYKPHIIDLTQSTEFAVGDIIHIRFRLHSNATKIAWGWAIDNLKVQTNGLNSGEQELTRLAVFPNPVINHELEIKGLEDNNINVRLFNSSGQLIFRQDQLKGNSIAFPKNIHGFYIMVLEGKGQVLTTKLQFD